MRSNIFSSRPFHPLMLLVTFLLATGALAPVGAYAAAQTGTPFYGPYDDGCYYWWDGTAWTQGWCYQQDGSWDVFVPGSGGWTLGWNQYERSDGAQVIQDATGIMTVFPDGSSVVVLTQAVDEFPAGTYVASGTTGQPFQVGYVDIANNFVPILELNQSGQWIDISTGTTSQPVATTNQLATTGGASARSGDPLMDMYAQCDENNDARCMAQIEQIWDTQNAAAAVWLRPACASSYNGC